MPVLTLLVGHSPSAKAKKAAELTARPGVVCIRQAELARALSGEFPDKLPPEQMQKLLLQKVTEALQAGHDVVLDADTRSPKYRKPYLQLGRKWGCRLEAVWLNTPFEQAVAENPELARQELLREQRYLRIPTYAEGFALIEVETSETVLPEAADFFHEQAQRLVADPPGLIRELEQDGRLKAWLPELHRAIPIDQHNPHHRYTVYEHILLASEVMAGTNLKMVWTILLHDIGKAYPGIKQFQGYLRENYGRWKKKDRLLIENGADIRDGRDPGDFYIVRGEKIPSDLVQTDLDGHFYDHENLGAQMAYRILTRFGYSQAFALEVATLIQFHMLLPRNTERAELRDLRQFYEKVGDCAADLLLVRLADDRGK